MGKSGIKDGFALILGVIAFLLAVFLSVPTIPIVILAGVAGVIYKKVLRR